MTTKMPELCEVKERVSNFKKAQPEIVRRNVDRLIKDAANMGYLTINLETINENNVHSIVYDILKELKELGYKVNGSNVSWE